MSNSNSKFGDLDRLIFGEDEFKLNSSIPSQVISESINKNGLADIKDHHFEDDNIDDGEVISLNHQVPQQNLEQNNKNKEEIIDLIIGKSSATVVRIFNGTWLSPYPKLWTKT